MAFLGKTVCVVLPAYNAAETLARTHAEIPADLVDNVVLVDDNSSDDTLAVARELGIRCHVHAANLGYGANQKTCYREALAEGADIVVMLHPDYQYSPRLVPALAWMVASGHYDVALGSRILGGTALSGGMPVYKYVANRVLTLAQNLVTGAKLSEYHTGYRAFSRQVLETLPLGENDDGFVFDNQVLAQTLMFGFRIGEVSCPTHYFAEASSVGFGAGLRYGLGVLSTTMKFGLQRTGLASFAIFSPEGRKLDQRPRR